MAGQPNPATPRDEAAQLWLRLLDDCATVPPEKGCFRRFLRDRLNLAPPATWKSGSAKVTRASVRLVATTCYLFTDRDHGISADVDDIVAESGLKATTVRACLRSLIRALVIERAEKEEGKRARGYRLHADFRIRREDLAELKRSGSDQFSPRPAPAKRSDPDQFSPRPAPAKRSDPDQFSSANRSDPDQFSPRTGQILTGLAGYVQERLEEQREGGGLSLREDPGGLPTRPPDAHAGRGPNARPSEAKASFIRSMQLEMGLPDCPARTNVEADAMIPELKRALAAHRVRVVRRQARDEEQARREGKIEGKNLQNRKAIRSVLERERGFRYDDD